MRPAVVSSTSGKFRQTVRVGPHALVADEPLDEGGGDAGPSPHEWILVGLAACTSMTLRQYAARKGWPLEGVEVAVQGERRDAEFLLTRHVRVSGPLSPEQMARLLEIANRCPVHKTLSGPIHISTDIAGA